MYVCVCVCFCSVFNISMINYKILSVFNEIMITLCEYNNQGFIKFCLIIIIGIGQYWVRIEL